MPDAVETLLEQIAPRLQSLSVASSSAYWDATTTGNPADAQRYSQAKSALLQFLSDPTVFARLQELHQAPAGQADPLARRQVAVLYHSYLENQLSADEIQELVARETELEDLFAHFRALVAGKRVSDNEIRHILQTEQDNQARREAWEASKQIGAEAGPRVRALVALRNRIARRLGFADYYSMSLTAAEIDEGQLFTVLDQLRLLTEAAFRRTKAKLDQHLAHRFGVPADQVMPWHYADPFFQEGPADGGVDLDQYFAGASLEGLTAGFYRDLGLPVDDILSRSDLYEREGKNQHAYCLDVDRQGDVRVLCNLKPREHWMSTMLHEFGHAVYDKYHDPALPWLLRTPAHINSTEAIAMLFGRQTRNADWLHQVAGVPAAEARRLGAELRRRLVADQLIFVRWGLVMVHFERALYKDPDQDLNGLWWRLVGSLQGVNAPPGRNSADWASKIHLATSPVYYHNYILGELTASQLTAHLRQRLGVTSLVGSRAAGEFLRTEIFRRGARHPWNELLALATGERLDPRHYVEQFVGATR